jgi:hypothetical protein
VLVFPARALWWRAIYEPVARFPTAVLLHRDGLVLGDAWRGWRVVGDRVTDPDGNETTQSQLQGYGLILQWVAAVAALDPNNKRQYYELLRRA